MAPFLEKLRSIQQKTNSVVCVGLDPDPARLPLHLEGDTLPEKILSFNRAIIDATKDFCCAFKPNLAFYEALGLEGWRVFEQTLLAIPSSHIIVADAKRGDIGNTGKKYAAAFLERLHCDSITVSPYMGGDSVTPFLQYEDKAAFILCVTSNVGSADFQKRELNREMLFRRVARMARNWNADEPGTAGLVVGATKPERLAEIRALAPELPFLIPGVGAQGGDAAAVVRASRTETGDILVNSSRAILYASSGPDFADAARRATLKLRDELNPV